MRNEGNISKFDILFLQGRRNIIGPLLVLILAFGFTPFPLASEDQKETQKDSKETPQNNSLGDQEPEPVSEPTDSPPPESLRDDSSLPQVSRSLPLEVTKFHRGPLAFRNIHPFYIPFYQPQLERAQALKKGQFQTEFRLSYASLQRADQVKRDFSFYDGEVLRSALHLRYGLGEKIELSIEFPFITSGNGFLDPIIKSFHNTTGLTEDQRRDFRYNERVFINNRNIINEGQRDFNFGDVPIQLKLQVLEDGIDQFGLALRAGLELPTGRSRVWSGSGTLEGGVGLLFEKSWGDFSLYLSADLRVLHTPRRLQDQGLKIHSTPVFAGALEWQFYSSCSLIAQFDAAENIVDGSPLHLFERNYLQVGLGLRFQVTPRTYGMIAVFEDVIEVTSPDVTFLANFGWDFGSK